jgi:hypothetical protein
MVVSSDLAMQQKATAKANELRQVADFIEKYSIENFLVTFSNGVTISLIHDEEFDRLMRGHQITLVPTRSGDYYDANGTRDGVRVACSMYRSTPKQPVPPLLCICGEPEVSGEEVAS